MRWMPQSSIRLRICTVVVALAGTSLSCGNETPSTGIVATRNSSTTTTLPPPTTECAQVFFLGARGSGQAQAGVTAAGGSFDAGTGFGPQVYMLEQRLQARLGGQRSIETEALTYPALGTETMLPSRVQLVGLAAGGASALIAFNRWTAKIDRYMDGITDGVNSAYRLLVARSSSCPLERLVLGGYSQGAMVMHRLTRRLAARGRYDILIRVDGLALIADGDRTRNHLGFLIGDPAGERDGIGVVAINNSIDRDVPDMVAPVTTHMCMKGDFVCDFHGVWSLLHFPSTSRIHSGSYTDFAILDLMARRIRNEVLRTPLPGVGAGQRMITHNHALG